MRALIIAIGLVLIAAVSAAQPSQPPNAQLTSTVTWDLLPAAQCEAPCTYEVSLDGTVLAPALTVGTFTFPKPGPGLHVIEIIAIDGQGRRSAASSKSWMETAGLVPAPLMPCTYQAPPAGSPLEQRPVGQKMQGFNPIGPSGITGNQAERIAQLEAWGWTVTLSQFVEGNLRPDRVDRLFLIVECKGL